MFPLIKGNVTRQAHVAVPPGTYEEEHARRGFFGRASHLFHVRSPTAWTRVEGPLRPRLLRAQDLPAGDDAQGTPSVLLRNDAVSVGVARPVRPMRHFVRNSDGDEIHFIHAGRGTYETDYGPLSYEPGDYLWFPKGTTHQVAPNGADTFVLIIESRHELEWPNRGLLGQHAFIDLAMVETPDPKPHESGREEFEVRVKRRDEWTSFYYDFHPLDVVGWKGDLAVGRGLPVSEAPGLEATHYFKAPKMTYTNGTHVIAVEVDPDTGTVRVLKYVVAHDCGRMINPMIVEGQIHGGLACGIGNALMEENLYDERGQLLSATFMDYAMPTAMVVPEVHITHLETPSPLNALGVKGAGECGAIPVPAALCGAIEDALSPLGVTLREVPLTPARVREAIVRATAERASE